jgi:hypothetical protein
VFRETFEFVSPELIDRESVFKREFESNKSSTCAFRFIGWLMMFGGVYLIFYPFIALLKWIPLIGWLLGKVASLVVIIFAFIVSVSLTLLTIALAWLFYRPLLGITLLAIIIILWLLMFYKPK